MAFYRCINVENFVLFDELASIGDSAFYGSAIKTLKLTSEFVSFGASAFEQCEKLESVTFESNNNNVTTIGNAAFRLCENLVDFDFSKLTSLETVQEYAFASCSKLSHIPNLQTYSNYSFSGCGIESLGFMGTTAIGDSAFSGCNNLKSLNFADCNCDIGNNAFSNCTSLTSLSFYGYGSNKVNIGNSAFYNCSSLKQLDISNNAVGSIGDYAFQNNLSLAYLDLSQVNGSIGEAAFWKCVSLTTVIIGQNVTSIGYRAFNDCYCLSTVVFQATAATASSLTFGGFAFQNCYSIKTVLVRDNSIWTTILGAMNSASPYNGARFANATIVADATI